MNSQLVLQASITGTSNGLSIENLPLPSMDYDGGRIVRVGLDLAQNELVSLWIPDDFTPALWVVYNVGSSYHVEILAAGQIVAKIPATKMGWIPSDQLFVARCTGGAGEIYYIAQEVSP